MKAPLRLALLGGLAVLTLAIVPLVGRQALPFSVLFDFGGSDPAAQTHFIIDKIDGALQSLGSRF